MPTVHILIKGKVQGVFFRATAREEAEKLALVGWVKNTQEGNVEAMVSGTDEQIKQFLDWCHQGPPKATVTQVIVTPKQDQVFKRFEVIR